MDNWQQRAAHFAQKHNLTHDAGVYALDVISELGEVAKEILTATDYGKKGSVQFEADKIGGELGDLLYSVCMLATAVDINLEHHFTQTLHKYETRQRTKGHISSGKSK